MAAADADRVQHRWRLYGGGKLLEEEPVAYDENPRSTLLERTGPDTFRSRSELVRDDGGVAQIAVAA